MKKLTAIAAAAIVLLTSCGNGNKNYSIKLKNGAVISATEENDRHYKTGDTVCTVNSSLVPSYRIDGRGYMQDTAIIRYTADSSTIAIVEYNIGIVQ